MPHHDEEDVIKSLYDQNEALAKQFINCIASAKRTRRNRQSRAGSGDSFSNVINRCTENLHKNLSHDPQLFLRAQACLEYYRNHSV